MPVNKYYTSADENCDKLEVFHNMENLCTISMKNEGTNDLCLIELNSDDLTDLINELLYIKKQIESNELH